MGLGQGERIAFSLFALVQDGRVDAVEEGGLLGHPAGDLDPSDLALSGRSWDVNVKEADLRLPGIVALNVGGGHKDGRAFALLQKESDHVPIEQSIE